MHLVVIQTFQIQIVVKEPCTTPPITKASRADEMPPILWPIRCKVVALVVAIICNVTHRPFYHMYAARACLRLCRVNPMRKCELLKSYRGCHLVRGVVRHVRLVWVPYMQVAGPFNFFLAISALEKLIALTDGLCAKKN